MMRHVWSMLSAVGIAMIGGAIQAGPLRVQDVAPAETVAALSISSLEDVLARLRGASLIEADEEASWTAAIRDLLETVPSEFAGPWLELLGTETVTDVVAGVAFGLVAWVEPGDPGGVLTVAGWLDAGDEDEAFCDRWDVMWEAVSARTGVTRERVRGRDVDVVGTRQAGAPFPSTFWHAREGSRILMANTAQGMERLIEMIDDGPGTDALGETEAWQAARAMVDDAAAVEAVLFLEPLFDAIALFDGMGVGRMVQASFDAAIGPVRALVATAGPGEGEVLAEVFAAAWMPEGSGGMLSLMDGHLDDARVPDWLGLDTVAYAALALDIRAIPEWMRSVIASNPMLMGVGQLLDQAEPTMRSIVDPLGDEIQSASTVTRPLTLDSLGNLLRIRCTNPRGLRDAIAAVAPQAGLEARDFQGLQVWDSDTGGLGLPMMPGVMPERVSMAVTADAVLVGQPAAVEAAIRSAGGGGSDRPSWLRRASGLVPPQVCMWGARDLEAFLTSVVQIQDLQFKAWEAEVRAEDPELWEMIRGELVDEDQVAMRRRLARLARALGPLVWHVQPTDRGFRGRAQVLAPQASSN